MIRLGAKVVGDEGGLVSDNIELACTEAGDANCSADRKVDSLGCSVDVPRTGPKTDLWSYKYSFGGAQLGLI